MENTIVNAYRELSFLKMVRDDDDDDGEGQFGLVPPSLDPNSALSKPRHHKESELSQQGPRKHPLLSKSAQFSGIDTRLTGDPQENENAQKHYPQLRLQQQLRNQQRQKPQLPPRPAR